MLARVLLAAVHQRARQASTPMAGSHCKLIDIQRESVVANLQRCNHDADGAAAFDCND